MNPHYNQNYSREEIDRILSKIKMCIRNGRCTISLNENRRENQDFINEYNIRDAKQKEILLQITADDFCHSLRNKKPGFEHEILYVFAPDAELTDAEDHPTVVRIYIKFNIIKTRSGDLTIVISFHPLNKPIDHAFRKPDQEQEELS